jgi:hypothetical protein
MHLNVALIYGIKNAGEHHAPAPRYKSKPRCSTALGLQGVDINLTDEGFN